MDQLELQENTEINEVKEKEFEISFLVKGENGSEEVIRLLKQHGFEITFEIPVRKITLAYKINKESQAYFGCFHFKGNGEEVSSLNQNLNTNSEVLRVLVITPPFSKEKIVSQKPQHIMKTPRPKVEPEEKPASMPLSNEALEKKIEEILQ